METKKALVVIVWRESPESQDKQVLLLKLIPSRGAFWQSVTGGVDKGESYAEAALREAQEESGLAFTRLPQYLGLEQTYTNQRNQAVRERAFFLPIFGGSQPPTPVLDGKEHDAYCWLPAEKAAALVKFPANRAAIERATKSSGPLFLSKNGNFFQEGEEVSHERTKNLFHQSLVRDESGRFFLRIGGEELDVVLESTARFVRSFDRESGRLFLSGGSEEILRPETLIYCEEASLLCTLENGWPASFLSAAYYEIAKDISASGTSDYVLHFLGRNYHLPIAR